MKPKKIEECGCCEAGIPAIPEKIKNRPGLSQISYRVGKYAGFRQAMIEAISKIPELKEWTARRSDDYGIALMEMWAYLADILTFYQERIANEAFLRTALHRDTIMRLAAMLDYKLNPGVAATTYLTFFVEEGEKVNIPVGLRVQSVPGQNEKPQKFETVEAVTAFSSLNKMRLKTTEPYQLAEGDTSAIVKGIDNDLKAGDHILLVGEERQKDAGSERWEVRRLTKVTINSEKKTTIIKWDNPLGNVPYTLPPQKNPRLFVFRLKAWPFGYNAPNWYLLSETLRDPKKDPNAPYKENWNEKCLPEDKDQPDQIFLDTVYDTIHPDSWIALVTAEPPCPKKLQSYSRYIELYRVKEIAETVREKYTLNSKVTRLTVDVVKGKADASDVQNKPQPEHINYFPMRGTFILGQSEPLTLAEKPIEKPVTNILNIDGYYPDLQASRTLLLTGVLSDKSGKQGMEVVEVDKTTPNAAQALTKVTLKKDLAQKYKIETVRLYGNVAKTTHGETVSGEILGSGDASGDFQEFTLKKSPTTFVPAANALRGAKNTLKIRVGGVRWNEVESLCGRKSKNPVYITRVDNKGKMTVQFGDGKTGARLPTGQDNVLAEYRQGLGSAGNVQANSLSTLLDRPLGLKSVSNPKQAEGGTDPESLQKARENAPNTVRTFERAISLRDYEDLARSYTGIAKAKAVKVLRNENEYIQLTIAGEKGKKIKITDQTYKNFMAYLDLHRDINHIVNVVPHSERPLALKAVIQADSKYLKEEVLSAARRKVLNYFDFNNLQLGQAIHLSDIYAVLQSVKGVNAAVIKYLDYKSQLPKIEAHLPIAPDRIATLNNADLKISLNLT